MICITQHMKNEFQYFKEEVKPQTKTPIQIEINTNK